MCSFQEVWLNYCIHLLSCVTVLSLLEISVIKMGNRSLGYFPIKTMFLGATLLWWFSCSCTLDVLSWVQFGGSFLITGRYYFPLTLWSDLWQICTTHYVMANKSIANQLNVQTLVLVLKSLQNSHHDLKVCFRICKHQVSIKTEDETLMNVEFSCFRCTSFIVFVSLLFLPYCSI